MTEQATNSLYGFETRPQVDKRRTDRSGTYDIKQLWQRSHEIIGMALLGHKNVEIARILNISEATVSNTLNGSLGKEKLDSLREERDEKYKDITERVDKLTGKALKVYNRLLEIDPVAMPTKLQKDVADTVVLDLAGHRAPTKISSQHLQVTATPAELEEFKARGNAAMVEAGFIDVTSEEENEDENT